MVVLLLLLLLLPLPIESQSVQQCPLDFSVVGDKYAFAKQATNKSRICTAIREELNLVIAAQLSKSQTFLFAQPVADSCIQEFGRALQQQGVTTDLKVQCNLDSQTLQAGSSRCPAITNVTDFRRTIGESSLSGIDASCRPPLGIGASCSSCTAAVVSSAVPGSNANWTCLDYTHIYAAGVVNSEGPTDSGTVACLFHNNGEDLDKEEIVRWWKYLAGAAAVVVVLGLLVLLVGFWYRRSCSGSCRFWKWKEHAAALRSRSRLIQDEESKISGANLNMIRRFEMDEMKAATNNFHSSMVIGQGGFGNVYKGVLADGTVVALKRLKNCSPSGDKEFIHEVEMMSSVRHKNLVPLLGWCIGHGAGGGHQRIIVYEFMSNGSLDDHLFKFRSSKRLDWPTRRKIAIGTARGIAYLHNGVQPSILHRDIKCSNILLDDEFNPKVGDFGLAKFFAPEGLEHVTTGVAGTQGYVAPEYVLYQQLTDRSDVYSFGVVLLELLSGKTALDSSMGQPIADWAWSLVKQGQMLTVLEQPPMEGLAAPEVMERFILVALLCAHPHIAYRPSMAQLVNMLETMDLDDPSLPSPATMPERPVSLFTPTRTPSETTTTMTTTGTSSTS